MKPLLRVIRYFKPYKGLAIGTLAAATGSTLVAMVGPYLIGLAIDEAIAGADARLLGQLVVGIIVAMLLRDGLNSLRIRLNNRLEQQVIYDMRNEVYRHLQTLPLSFYSDRSTGELMSLGRRRRQPGGTRAARRNGASICRVADALWRRRHHVLHVPELGLGRVDSGAVFGARRLALHSAQACFVQKRQGKGGSDECHPPRQPFGLAASQDIQP